MLSLLILLACAQVGLAVFAASALDWVYEQFSQSTQRSLSIQGTMIPLMATLLLAVGLSEFLRRWLTESLGLDYARDVRLALLERHLRKPFHGGKRRSQGNELLPFVGDLTALRNWWADGVARGFSSAMVALGLCVYLLWIQPRFGSVMLAVCLGSVALMCLIAAPYAEATRRQRRARGMVTGLISNRIGAAHSVFAQGGFHREIQIIRKKTDQMNSASLQRARWSGSIRGVTAIAPIAASFLTLLVSQSSPAQANSHSVVGSLLLAGIFGSCISDLGRSLELAIPGQIAMRRLEGRLAEINALRISPNKKSKNAKNKPAILNIRNLVLNGWSSEFSAICKTGDVIFIDDVLGTQKSMFLATLTGLQPLTQGRIEIFGQKTESMSQKLRRQHLGIASPSLPLLQGSVETNILYRLRGEIDFIQIHALMKLVGLTEYLIGNEKISRKLVRDDGKNMAPTDVAAIKLVRALVGSPQILVLDGVLDDLPTSVVDNIEGVLRNWQGIVLITSKNNRFRAIANRQWQLSDHGMHETDIPFVEITNVFSLNTSQALNP